MGARRNTIYREYEYREYDACRLSIPQTGQQLDIARDSKWGAPRAGAFDYLREITHPTLVINGSNDVIIYTVNSFIFQQNLPNAQLILYPDSNHGSQYQYPALFVADVTRFLDAEAPLAPKRTSPW